MKNKTRRDSSKAFAVSERLSRFEATMRRTRRKQGGTGGVSLIGRSLVKEGREEGEKTLASNALLSLSPSFPWKEEENERAKIFQCPQFASSSFTSVSPVPCRENFPRVTFDRANERKTVGEMMIRERTRERGQLTFSTFQSNVSFQARFPRDWKTLNNSFRSEIYQRRYPRFFGPPYSINKINVYEVGREAYKNGVVPTPLHFDS